jgi:hypothetical protein
MKTRKARSIRRSYRLSRGLEWTELAAVNLRLPKRPQHFEQAVRATLGRINDLDTDRPTVGRAINQDSVIQPLRCHDAVALLPRQIHVGCDRETSPISHLQRNSLQHGFTLNAVITTITRSTSSGSTTTSHGSPKWTVSTFHLPIDVPGRNPSASSNISRRSTSEKSLSIMRSSTCGLNSSSKSHQSGGFSSGIDAPFVLGFRRSLPIARLPAAESISRPYRSPEGHLA